MTKRKEASLRSSSIIKRTAIDFSGRLGSLYNGCHDRIVGALNVTCDNSSEELLQRSQCILLKGNSNRNLLQLIDIDEQLRLSLLLNLTSKNGIATLLDHPQTINEYTRIFHYTYLYRQEHFPDEVSKIRELLPTIMPEMHATHIITGISWGIDIVIILQLPPDDNIAKMIDYTLEKYQTYLNGDRNNFKRTREDIDSIEKILNTQMYSNILELNRMTLFHDLFHNISRLKIDETNHQPLSYTLCPIQAIYHQNFSSHYVYRSLDSTNNVRSLEQFLVELSTSMKTLEICFNENMQYLLCGHFKERLANAYKQWSIVKQEYSQIIDHYAKLIFDIRCGQIRSSTINKKLQNKTQIDIKNRINNLAKDVIDLNAKGHLIIDLSYQRIQYLDVTEHNVTANDNETSLKHKLIVDENSDRVFCSNDILNKNNPTLFQELRHNLVDELTKNLKLRLIYADFSYCNYQLHHMMILPSNNKHSNKKKIKQENVSSSTKMSTPIINPLLSKSKTTETINILLLGETGVGKSTFINALINYLTFKTLNKAQSNKPIVAIPVSFLMTIGDNLNKYEVKVNNSNHSKNENFDQPGQSVTQHCKSYVYNLNEKIKLRIIDTPGFGDIRGVDQDDQNMQHILQYIKKFDHLNAICFLLKSNESRLNIFLRSCLTQLFNLFGSNIRDNLIFCFTNSRTTSYTSGHTASLLKDILSSFSIRKIPFKKKNTFYFDSESFRYLIALQNQVPFTDHDQQEYEISWKNSMTELNRLIHYIHKKLHTYSIPNEHEIIRQITIKIVHLTHPMVEIIRYILRNIIINKMNSLKQTIESSYEINNDHHNYQHLPHQPILLNFLQDYKITNEVLKQKQDDMIDHLSLFCHISAELGYFLVHVAHYRGGDPFLTGLFRLIREESNICEKQNRNYMNLQLVDSLKKLTSNYEQHIQANKSNPKQTTLTDIYEWIKYMNDYPLISGYIIDSKRTNIENENKISMI